MPADHAELAELLTEAFGEGASWDAERVASEFSPGNGVEATAAARVLPDRYPGAGYKTMDRCVHPHVHNDPLSAADRWP